MTKSLICLVVSCLVSLPHASAQSSVPPQTSQKKPSKGPPIERLDQHRIKVGDVLVNRLTRRVEVPAQVNMTQGILEYFGVAIDGKLHESVVRILATPSHIHLGLILAGYQPSEYGAYDAAKDKRSLKRRGDLLRIYLRWRPTELDHDQWLPASAWLFHRKKGGAPPPIPYIFEGSIVTEEGYMADRDKSVIGLIEDPTVILAATESQGNPYRGAQEGLEVYSSVIPPKGTPVTLVIQGATDQEIKEIAHYKEELAELAAVRLKREEEQSKLKPLPAPPPYELLLHLNARSSLSYETR